MGKKEVVKQKKRTNKSTPGSETRIVNICINTDCKLRKKGCRGFEGCPGYKAR